MPFTPRTSPIAATVCAGLVALIAGCNGQFDFDTAPLDAGDADIVFADGASNVDAIDVPPTDAPKVGIRIACGSESCEVLGCCGTTAGFTCVDVAKGGICGGLLLQCDDTADCPAGQVCCAEGNDLLRTSDSSSAREAALTRVHCEPEAHCRSSNYVILCDPDRLFPCTQCVASSLAGLPPGYHQCATAR